MRTECSESYSLEYQPGTGFKQQVIKDSAAYFSFKYLIRGENQHTINVMFSFPCEACHRQFSSKNSAKIDTLYDILIKT